MARPATVLIRNAEVWDGGAGDVRIKDGAIAAVGQLVSEPGETVIDAAGSLLLPGLHDHHIHLAGLAARGMSVKCGPPDVTTPAALAERLSAPGSGWLRGIGYHESVMGLPDALELDRMLASRPLRIQHRSGRMWLLNSLALEQLLARRKPPPGLERVAGQFTGRLFDEDQWLQAALGSSPPVLAAVSAELAGYGVTGVTDMSPRNDPAMAAHFTAQIAGGSLRQRLMLAGSLALAQAEAGPWQLGPAKLHLHEADLPILPRPQRSLLPHTGRTARLQFIAPVKLRSCSRLLLWKKPARTPATGSNMPRSLMPVTLRASLRMEFLSAYSRILSPTGVIATCAMLSTGSTPISIRLPACKQRALRSPVAAMHRLCLPTRGTRCARQFRARHTMAR